MKEAPPSLYNTLTGAIEPIHPIKNKRINLFVCGPTVYDYSHIGHARTYVFFDFLARFLRHKGYTVFYLQNITDVDDKIIKRAAEENKNPSDLAKFFTEKHLADMKALGIDSVDAYAPATKFIPQIIEQVKKLIEKGYAYKIEGDGYYFDIAKFPEYGKLSGRTVLQAEDGVSRIDESIAKKNKGDFCLWKFSKLGEPSWEAPFGSGRPGWHIEDTAISEHYFGPQYDMHGGSLDLKFPHHEAEIAQQEAASGKKPFVHTWIHTGFLTTHGDKMSKSLGNFVTIEAVLKKFSPAMLRYYFLSHHYRSPVDYDERSFRDAIIAVSGVDTFLQKMDFIAARKLGTAEFDLKKFEKKFEDALNEDLNTPAAFAAIFEIVNEVNKNPLKLSPKAAEGVKKFITNGLELFGIPFESVKIPLKIKALAEEREKFRTSEQFVKSDRLRKELNDLGYVVEDTERGPFVSRKPTP